MQRESLLSQLNNNKEALENIEDRLNGGYGQEEGAYMLKEQETLLAERDTLTTALSAQETRLRLFALRNPERECVLIAKTEKQKLEQRCENGNITQEMCDDAHAAINYELECFKVTSTTIDEFEAQVTTAIEQALNQTSSQASYG